MTPPRDMAEETGNAVTLDLDAIRQRLETATERGNWRDEKMWPISASLIDIPILIAEIERLRAS